MSTIGSDHVAIRKQLLLQQATRCYGSRSRARRSRAAELRGSVLLCDVNSTHFIPPTIAHLRNCREHLPSLHHFRLLLSPTQYFVPLLLALRRLRVHDLSRLGPVWIWLSQTTVLVKHGLPARVGTDRNDWSIRFLGAHFLPQSQSYTVFTSGRKCDRSFMALKRGVTDVRQVVNGCCTKKPRRICTGREGYLIASLCATFAL
ncbi:hypothetical protein F4781DRAFT_202553 [Annulohypoxylon bovei var. microspora]|nr:hypothetical protein F4781DRAFT_202553 [Annulohypoxylon bovei var. microspora]